MPHNNYKPKNGYRKANQALGLASKVAKLARDVMLLKALINVEYKSIQISFTVDPNTTGAVVNLTPIAEGSGISERTGVKVKLYSMRIKGLVKLYASATNTYGRMVVVRDNIGRTTQPTIADCFGSATNCLNNHAPLDDPQTAARFSILYDRWFSLNSNTQEQFAVDKYRKIGSHITYTGALGTDEGKGNIYLFIVSSEATNDPAVEITSIFKYIDN